MAIGFIAATAAGTISNTAVTTNSVNVPTGTIVGDVMISSATTTQAITVTTPTGWTAQPVAFNASTGVRLYGFTRVVDGTEGASIAYAHTSTAVFVANIMTFRKIGRTTPVRSTNTAAAAAALTCTFAAPTGQTAADMVVILAGERPEASGVSNLTMPSASGWIAPAAAAATDGSTSGFKASCGGAYKINGAPIACTTSASSGIAVASFALIESPDPAVPMVVLQATAQELATTF